MQECSMVRKNSNRANYPRCCKFSHPTRAFFSLFTSNAAFQSPLKLCRWPVICMFYVAIQDQRHWFAQMVRRYRNSDIHKSERRLFPSETATQTFRFTRDFISEKPKQSAMYAWCFIGHCVDEVVITSSLSVTSTTHAFGSR